MSVLHLPTHPYEPHCQTVRHPDLTVEGSAAVYFWQNYTDTKYHWKQQIKPRFCCQWQIDGRRQRWPHRIHTLHSGPADTTRLHLLSKLVYRVMTSYANIQQYRPAQTKNDYKRSSCYSEYRQQEATHTYHYTDQNVLNIRLQPFSGAPEN